ncbi:hypothetical protein Tco_0625823 [Tanacetum coccineum]|uniref:Uncharacterized protein n=1 Tax=Tanacetum coccineum TaxID=301880 RepID=A0ABQ4WHX5_9ASTR
MDDPNITIEEYIRLEEEKARKHGKVFNWETAKISFDESDDEDYTIVYDENSFSYKIISVNNLKTNSENDNEKVNMPLFPSPEPKDNDNDKIDIEQPSGDMSVIPSPNTVYTVYPNPMDMAYRQSEHYPVLIFSTIYTTYSLNEYGIYMYQYGVSWGMDMAYRLPV